MLRVVWEVDDGYAGKSRPQYTEIDESEFEEDMTEQDRQDVIETLVQEDFHNKISWYIKRIEEV